MSLAAPDAGRRYQHRYPDEDRRRTEQSELSVP
jgi:hypothetical protein